MKRVRLGDKNVAIVNSGQPAPQDIEAFGASGHPFVRAGNLEFLCNGGSESDLEHISPEMAKKFRLKLFPENTVIFAKSGMSAKIGRVYKLKEPAYLVSHLAAITTCESLDATYLSYFLKKNSPSNLIPNEAYPSIRLTEIENISINLPELIKQHRISTILNKIEAIICKRKKCITTLDELVKSRFVEMFGNPLNPKEKKWQFSDFGNEFSIFSGGTPSTHNNEFWENGDIPWIGSNMCQDKIIYNNDGKFITQKGLKNSSAKIVDKGNVLIALVGATIGKTALLKFDTATNQNIAAIDVKNNHKFSPEYIFYLIQFLYNKFLEIGSNKFKMANLSFIRDLPLPCPPFENQVEFSRYTNKIEDVRSSMQSQLHEAETLKSALLQKYFSQAEN